MKNLDLSTFVPNNAANTQNSPEIFPEDTEMELLSGQVGREQIKPFAPDFAALQYPEPSSFDNPTPINNTYIDYKTIILLLLKHFDMTPADIADKYHIPRKFITNISKQYHVLGSKTQRAYLLANLQKEFLNITSIPFETLVTKVSESFKCSPYSDKTRANIMSFLDTIPEIGDIATEVQKYFLCHVFFKPVATRLTLITCAKLKYMFEIGSDEIPFLSYSEVQAMSIKKLIKHYRYQLKLEEMIKSFVNLSSPIIEPPVTKAPIVISYTQTSQKNPTKKREPRFLEYTPPKKAKKIPLSSSVTPDEMSGASEGLSKKPESKIRRSSKG